jgi:hypothetical protein
MSLSENRVRATFRYLAIMMWIAWQQTALRSHLRDNRVPVISAPAPVGQSRLLPAPSRQFWYPRMQQSRVVYVTPETEANH